MNIYKILYRPKLLELCDDFEQLTSAGNQKSTTQHIEDTILKNQRRDLFYLGVLLDSILEMEKSSPLDYEANSDNISVTNFITLCQSAKSVEELVDHKYLIHGNF